MTDDHRPDGPAAAGDHGAWPVTPPDVPPPYDPASPGAGAPDAATGPGAPPWGPVPPHPAPGAATPAHPPFAPPDAHPPPQPPVGGSPTPPAAGPGAWPGAHPQPYPPPYPQPHQQGPPAWYPNPYTPLRPAVPYDGLAIASLVIGIASIVLAAFCCLGVTGAAGLPMGIVARRRIQASHGAKQGDGMALAGIICNSIGLGLFALVIAFFGFGLAVGL